MFMTNRTYDYHWGSRVARMRFDSACCEWEVVCEAPGQKPEITWFSEAIIADAWIRKWLGAVF